MTKFIIISMFFVLVAAVAYQFGCLDGDIKGFKQGAAMVRNAWDLPGDKNWR